MKVYEAIARALADIEVTQLFGLIGDANLFLVDSYIKNYKGQYIPAAHEAGAVQMAMGYAQLSGRIGVATVTHGPGLTNTITSLIEGVKSAIPMVLLAGDTPIEAPEHLQNVKQRELISSTGAGFEQLRAPSTITEDITLVFRRAWIERRPIVLNMPVNFQWQEIEYEKPVLYLPETRSGIGASIDMDNAIGIIASARWPIVLAGRGAAEPSTRAAILRFAERIDAPVATTVRSKNLFEGEPFNLGICGTVSHPVAVEAFMTSDTIISFGASLNQYTTAQGSMIKDKRLIQVNPSASEIGRYYPVDAGLVGDPGVTADIMTDWLDEAEIPGSGARTTDLGEKLDNRRKGKINMRRRSMEGTVDIHEALAAVNSTLPKNRILVSDVGRYMLAGWTGIDVETPRSYVYTHGFTAIGLGLGEAIGAAIASQGQPILLLVGDGGLMLGGFTELVTAVNERLNLIIVVCNDGCYGAEHIQFQSKNLKSKLAQINWPDFAPIAHAFGAAGTTVSNSDELHSAMAALRNRDCTVPFLIDIKMDPEAMPQV